MANEPDKMSSPNLSLRSDTEVKTAVEPKVFEEIFRLFKAQLVSGELLPSDRLLPERDLSQKLGVSRASLREVMRVLALLGVVESRPGQGTFVRTPDVSILQDYFALVLAMQPTLYEHLLEARIAIECRAIRLAARQASPEDHAQIGAALERIRATLTDPDLGAEADFDFHAAIVRASQNAVLLFIHEAIASHLRRSHHERREAVLAQPNLLSKLLENHARIYEAILTGDADRAEAVLKEHFTLGQRTSAHSGG